MSFFIVRNNFQKSIKIQQKTFKINQKTINNRKKNEILGESQSKKTIKYVLNCFTSSNLLFVFVNSNYYFILKKAFILYCC